MLQEDKSRAYVHDGARCQSDSQPLPDGRLARVAYKLLMGTTVDFQNRGHDAPPYGFWSSVPILRQHCAGVK